MKKRIVLIIFSIVIFNLVFAAAYPKPEEMTIKEITPGSRYTLKIINGVPTINGFLHFINDKKTYKVLFILDTSCATSYLYEYNRSIIEENFDISMNNKKHAFVSLQFDDFAIEKMLVSIEEKVRNPILPQEESTFDLYGAIGNDILLQKSFYLSLTKKEFGWIEKFEFSKPENLDTYKLNTITYKNKNNNTQLIWPTIYTDDNFFNSENFFLFQKYDGTGSRYWVSTGAYEIKTSSNDFTEQIEKHKYKNVQLKGFDGQYGFCSIPKAALFGKRFENLNVSALPLNTSDLDNLTLKAIGCQVLAAFDLYFDKQNTESLKQLYFIPVNEKDYNSFRKTWDKEQINKCEPIIFYVNNQNKVILRIDKEAYSEISLGDELVSINGNPFINNFKYKLKKGDVLKLKKENNQLLDIIVK